MLIFSEHKNKWQQIPRWVDYFIQFGFRWHRDVLEQRRIALISMPCDSVAAGLIALGALIRDLGNPNANDIDGHYNSLLQYARQYIESCRFCDSCNPEKKSCGYTTKATGWIRDWHTEKPKRFKISEKTNLIEKRLLLNRQGGTWEGSPRYATGWQIDGEPPPQLTNNESALYGEPYERINSGSQIVPGNLQRSFSGLCFAGRVSGETATRKMCASACFRFNDSEFCISDLLTIHGWSHPSSISRMTFFNPRTERFDRYSSTPSLTVADGDKSFLKILRRTEFQRSDVIGVINRILERTDLEAVGSQINALTQWYTDDFETLDKLPSVPQGISVRVLKRRTA